MDVLERNACRGLKPSMFLRLQPFVHARFQSIQLLHRGPPRDLHRKTFERFATAPGICDKHIEQLAVEIIRLGAIRTSKDGSEQSHLLHNQVLVTNETSITSIKWMSDEQEHDCIERAAGRTLEDETCRDSNRVHARQ